MTLCLFKIREVLDRLAAIQETLDQMANRSDFDALKAQLQQALADLANRVTNDIQSLREQIAAGAAITDQDLADLQADIAAAAAIDPAPVPPTPEPAPEPPAPTPEPPPAPSP